MDTFHRAQLRFHLESLYGSTSIMKNKTVPENEQNYHQEQPNDSIPFPSNGFTAFPPKRGLYNPANEREACGVGFVVSIDGHHTHKVLIG